MNTSGVILDVPLYYKLYGLRKIGSFKKWEIDRAAKGDNLKDRVWFHEEGGLIAMWVYLDECFLTEAQCRKYHGLPPAVELGEMCELKVAFETEPETKPLAVKPATLTSLVDVLKDMNRHIETLEALGKNGAAGSICAAVSRRDTLLSDLFEIATDD